MLNNIEITTYHWSRTVFKFTVSPLSNINQSLDHCIHRLKCKWRSLKIRLYNLGPNNWKPPVETVAVSQWTLRISSALSAPGPKWSRSITCTAQVHKWLKCHPGIHVTNDARWNQRKATMHHNVQRVSRWINRQLNNFKVGTVIGRIGSIVWLRPRD